MEDDEERNHWIDVMRTFLTYREFVVCELERRQKHINRLPEKFASRLPSITFEKLGALDQASKVNQGFLSDMVEFHASSCFGVEVPIDKNGPQIHISQQHRNQAVLHSLFREWSVDGREERESTFRTIITQLETHLPVKLENAFEQRIVAPGCGLGRLPLEIASRGYSCEGNEFSAFMAICSNFMLNGIHEKDAYDIFPWIENICNTAKVGDVMKSITVPDVTATELLANGPFSHVNTDHLGHPKFSMAAGDFAEIYSGEDCKGAYDGVVTCFFIDTAPVVMQYIETIVHMLRPGGVWVNQGPLLYHWVADVEENQDPRYDQSIELSYEEIRAIIEGYGLQFLHEEWIECSYTRCASSMMWTQYRTIQFSVRKPLSSSSSSSNSE